ncbi:MAG TPA: hypothetical protein VHI52_01915, partial [Verrucomicrobiae bacterium]|nr:hypothetical protein [Verrucomicrobiae bacterium]
MKLDLILLRNSVFRVALTLLALGTLHVSAAEKLLAWPGETVDTWHGYRRHNFTVDGCQAWIVEPEHPRPDRPWAWCMEFPDAFLERGAGPGLLA